VAGFDLADDALGEAGPGGELALGPHAELDAAVDGVPAEPGQAWACWHVPILPERL